MPGFLEKDPVKQNEMYGKLIAETIIPHVQMVEKQLRKNNTGYLVGDQVIDIFLIDCFPSPLFV